MNCGNISNPLVLKQVQRQKHHGRWAITERNPWEKNWPPWMLIVSSQWAHRELTVTKMVTASRDSAVTWAVIELWPSRDWAVIILKMPWLSCDLAVTELWPRCDWAVTSPSRDWAVIIGPGAVTTVVTMSSRWFHRELTVSSRWQFFSHGKLSSFIKRKYLIEYY